MRFFKFRQVMQVTCILSQIDVLFCGFGDQADRHYPVICKQKTSARDDMGNFLRLGVNHNAVNAADVLTICCGDTGILFEFHRDTPFHSEK